jgi:hypothetical protein
MNIATQTRLARIPARPNATLLCTLALLSIAFVLAVCSSVGAHSHLRTMSRRPTRAVPQPASVPAQRESAPASPRGSGSLDAVEFDGDQSLDAAAVIRQTFEPSTRYVVHVHLPSGADQSIAVNAPPGGLELEVRDMTGDNVRNDLVLRPALVHWPLSVLVNDGHDHFTVSISGVNPGAMDSGGDQASTPDRTQEIAALVSSFSEASALANRWGTFLPQLQQSLIASISQTVTISSDRASSSGRAPPSAATRIS